MMANLIKVRAVEGRTLPLELAPRRSVVGEMDVPDTSYYRRAIARGDIERVEAKPAAPRRATAKEE